MSLNQMIFVTGFARGGTSWLRDCIAFHPGVQSIPGEMPIFRDSRGDRQAIVDQIEAATAQVPDSPMYVNKAPSNAPYIGEACRMFPEAKFVYIARDPRDAYISHKRSTREWTGGRNSQVEGCLGKLERYWNGRLDAGDAANLLVLRYEDLHQDFSTVLARIYAHCDLESDEVLLEDCWKANNFWAVGSKNREDRDAAARKGVVGDWIEHLKRREERWIRKNRFWSGMMDELGYHWDPPTYESIYRAISTSNPRSLSIDDLLACRLDEDRLNLVMLRDVDHLDSFSCSWVEDAAALDSKFDFHAVYNLLPLDDPRYSKWSTSMVAEFALRLVEKYASVELGMHVNPVEKHVDFDAPDLGEQDDDVMDDILATLHEQIDRCAGSGLKFRFGTAHGYGRGSRRPNNRHSPAIADELDRNGIALWDTRIRPTLVQKASHAMSISDVGGAIGMYKAPNSCSLDDPDLYKALPPGSLLIMLQHPANYDPARRLQLGQRTAAIQAQTV